MVVKVNEDGEVVGVEVGGRPPQGCNSQVGAAESKVGGGRVSTGREPGGGIGVEEAEGAIC